MQTTAHFRVDPKLAHVLGENYTSSEKALKELIDNAWDAEATEVHVTVPNILGYTGEIPPVFLSFECRRYE